MNKIKYLELSELLNINYFSIKSAMIEKIREIKFIEPFLVSTIIEYTLDYNLSMLKNYDVGIVKYNSAWLNRLLTQRKIQPELYVLIQEMYLEVSNFLFHEKYHDINNSFVFNIIGIYNKYNEYTSDLDYLNDKEIELIDNCIVLVLNNKVDELYSIFDSNYNEVGTIYFYKNLFTAIMYKTGELWLANEITPAKEHQISEVMSNYITLKSINTSNTKNKLKS